MILAYPNVDASFLGENEWSQLVIRVALSGLLTYTVDQNYGTRAYASTFLILFSGPPLSLNNGEKEPNINRINNLVMKILCQFPNVQTSIIFKILCLHHICRHTLVFSRTS